MLVLTNPGNENLFLTGFRFPGEVFGCSKCEKQVRRVRVTYVRNAVVQQTLISADTVPSGNDLVLPTRTYGNSLN